MWTVSLLKVSSSSRHECTCQVGGAEESDAGSVREEVRSELANVVLPGQRLRRCGSSSIETGDQDCGKRETADHCTGHHRLWSEDHELQYFQVWRTDGEALVRVRGSERQPGLEQWRRLAAMYDPLAARRSSGDIRQIFSPTKGTKLEDFSHALQARENLEQRHQERTGDKLPKDMRPAILLAKGVNSTATPVPGLRTSACAYIVTVITPVLVALLRRLWKIGTVRLVTVVQEATRPWKVRTDNCTAWRSRTARESLPSPRAKAAKKVEARKVKLTQNVSGAGALATSELDCRAKSHVNGGPRKSALRGNGIGNCQDEEQETH